MKKFTTADYAKHFGGFYYEGAWRFPSVWAKDEFLKALRPNGEPVPEKKEEKE